MSYFKFTENETRTLLSLEEGIKSQYFFNREFSFTLANDVYVRYLCFKNVDEFKNALVEKVPFKIDMGAVFNIPPKNHLTADKQAFIPLEKEMVFDIDMTDYDNVRTCCDGAKVCSKCWEFMALATTVLNKSLTEDFGFEALLWVFSGRRGIHCWICDDSARTMNNEARTAVTDYMSLSVGNEMSGKLELSYPLHPHLQNAYKILSKKFQKIIIEDQDLLSL